jgi:hypothetical protein
LIKKGMPMDIASLKKILCLVLIVCHTHSAAKPVLHYNRTVNISAQPCLHKPEDAPMFHQTSPGNPTGLMSRPRLFPALISSAVILITCIYAYCTNPRNQMAAHPADDESDSDDDDDHSDDGYGNDPSNAQSNRAYFQQTIDPSNAQTEVRYFHPFPDNTHRRVNGRSLSLHMQREQSVFERGHRAIQVANFYAAQMNALQRTSFVPSSVSPFQSVREIILINHGDDPQRFAHFTDVRTYFLRTFEGRIHVDRAVVGALVARRVRLNHVNYEYRRTLDSGMRGDSLYGEAVLHSLLYVRSALANHFHHDMSDIIFMYAFSQEDFGWAQNNLISHIVHNCNALRDADGRTINSNLFRIVQ